MIRRYRRGLVTLLCFVAFACGSSAFLHWYFVREYWTLITTRCAGGEELSILEEAYRGKGVRYCCEVRTDAHVVVPRTYIDAVYPGGQSSFEIVKSKHNQVVGVLWKEANEYICLYDSSTEKHWPRGSEATKQELIHKLEAADGP